MLGGSKVEGRSKVGSNSLEVENVEVAVAIEGLEVLHGKLSQKEWGKNCLILVGKLQSFYRLRVIEMENRENENMKEKMRKFYKNMNVRYMKPLINCFSYLCLVSHSVASVVYISDWLG